MSSTTYHKRSDEVRRMFTHIAGRYDLLNHLMTTGRDRLWRRDTIRTLDLQPGDWLLDIGTGTGALVFEALRQQEDITPVACDFTGEMIERGRRHANGQKIHWVIADAQALPFAPASFDASVSGFLLRNVESIQTALREQARTLKPSGRIASLDTTPVKPGILQPLLHLYFQRVIPTLGRWIAGNQRAYTYLVETTNTFLTASKLAQAYQSCGFNEVGFIHRMLGTIAIHWGRKPHQDSEGQVHNHSYD